MTENKMAAPSIHPAWASPSSSTPPAAWPQPGIRKKKTIKRKSIP